MVTRTTGIEWTDKTWNPTTGCDKISTGCDHCYASDMARRLKAMGNPRYTRGFQLTLHRDKLTEPLKWKVPARIFVNSMSDILHQDIPDEFILSAFRTMVHADWHEFHLLTKRPGRWRSISEQVVAEFGAWPKNVLPGTTVENRAALGRLRALAKAGDADTIRMVSMEPLLDDLGPAAELGDRLIDCGIGWVISGGEAGFSARPANADWFRTIRDACKLADVPFFHKQHGGPGVTKTAKRGGAAAELDGVLHHAHPVVVRGPAPDKRQAGLF